MPVTQPERQKPLHAIDPVCALLNARAARGEIAITEAEQLLKSDSKGLDGRRTTATRALKIFFRAVSTARTGWAM